MGDKEIKEKLAEFLPYLNEKQKRIYLSLEAKSLGYGGIRKISKLSGISGVTITKGMEGLKETGYKSIGRVRIGTILLVLESKGCEMKVVKFIILQSLRI